MRLVTTFIQNTESTDPDLSYLNRARFVLSVADGHGSDGVGILDAVIRNRHLFLSMTSGAEIDAGSVFTEDDLPVASDSRLGIAAFDPAYFSILAGKVSLRGDLDFGLNETQLAEYLTANKYATQAWVAAQGFIGSDGLALYATKEWVLGQNFAKASSLGNYLLKSVWDEVFEVTTVNGVRVLNVKLDIAGLKGISAYGLGSTSGGSASGSLGELVNVGQWADAVPTADRVMVQLAGATHWSAKPLADLVGLDTAALAQYLTANSYLKASDISSYLTWANLSGKPTVYPTSWELVTGRPTKLSDLTDDVVAGNYLPKPTWDAVFEVVTVDGTPVLKVKYDILGLKGITAYADGTLSGGFSGALVDLVDVAVTNLASGDILKYNGTHFVNVPVSSIAGASSWDQITGKPEYYPTRWADVSGAPTSLPASDVYPWAKTASKPTYTAAEVGALALSGGIITGSLTVTNGFTSGIMKCQTGAYPQLQFEQTNTGVTSILFVTATNDLIYRPDNSKTGADYAIYHSGNFTPSSKLDKSVWDEAFELKTVNGVRVISAKLDFLSVAGISAYGLGSTSGGSASGSLGELVNVGQWADAVPTADRVMVQLAGATHWSAKPLADLVGLDTAALAQYLTANSYLKASDISSYLTWANLSGKPTVYPTSWELVTGRPTKLSDLTDDVVAGNYLPKPTWDAVFEVVTVDGTPVLKVKYDILGLKGITAYADGTLSGGFSGALVDLVDVAVTNLASGDILKYNGTHFVNVPVSSIAGASSWDQITGKPEYYPTRWADVSGAPTSLPASDVYPWAKTASKPTYTAAEVGALALSGGIITGSLTVTNGFTSGIMKCQTGAYPQLQFEQTNTGVTSILFVTATNDLIYRPDNSKTGADYAIYHSGNFTPSSKLDKSVWDEAFELKTVNGVRVISAKLDFLSVAGISAYATGPSSGGGGGGLDYDLLKQALTGAITPDGYPFTISASFLGAIDKTYLTGKLANTYANKVHTHLWVDITDRPTALPANGGNADTVDNLHASSFTRADQEPDVDLDTVNGQGIMACRANTTATAERHYPIQQAGTLFYGTAAYKSANQIYGSFNSNRWFVRGGGTSPTAKTAWAEIWTTSNFNPDNYLNAKKGLISDLNTATGSGVYYFSTPGSVNTPENYGSLLVVATVDNGSPWINQFAFGTSNKIWHRQNINNAGWNSWTYLYDSGNFNPGNYLLLSGGTMTGDITFGSNGRSLRGSDGGNIAGVLYDTPNARYVTAIGTGSRRLILVSPASIYRGAGGVAENYMIYDSSNSNISTVDWAAKNITAAGTIVSMSTVESRGNNSTGILPQMLWHLPNVSYTRIRMASDGGLHILNGGSEAYQNLYAQNLTANNTVTATKLVIGGITIDVYNGALRVNGNLVATGGVTAYQ